MLRYGLLDSKGENSSWLGYVGSLMMLQVILRHSFEYMSWMNVSTVPLMYWVVFTTR